MAINEKADLCFRYLQTTRFQDTMNGVYKLNGAGAAPVWCFITSLRALRLQDQRLIAITITPRMKPCPGRRGGMCLPLRMICQHAYVLGY